MMKRKFRIGTVALAAAVLTSAQAHSAGFEKATLWSGHYAGIGSAATSVVGGSQSLFFNPAGLANGSGLEVSGNFSPTWSKFSGPFVGSTVVDGNTEFSPIFGLTVSDKLTDKLAVGAGYFVAGGDISSFDNLDFSAANANFAGFKPSSKLDLKILDASLGAAYELLDGLRIGAAWRISFVKANLSSAGVIPVGPTSALAQVDLKDLTATRYNGFRIGAQYSPHDSRWGIGANWRTAVNFIAKGTASGTAAAAANGSQGAITGANAQAYNEFPTQISMGAYYWLSPSKFRLIPEYTFTRYAVNRTVDLEGAITLPANIVGAAVPTTLNAFSIPQHWHNMHNIRLGAEYLLQNNIVLRAGYVLTTKVTPNDLARPTFASPGTGHTMTAGVGYSIMSNLALDGALEYSRASGNGTATNGATGEFSTKAYVAHLGLTYQY